MEKVARDLMHEIIEWIKSNGFQRDGKKVAIYGSDGSIWNGDNSISVNIHWREIYILESNEKLAGNQFSIKRAFTLNFWLATVGQTHFGHQ